MELGILNTAGKIAGIGGLAIGMFLILFRDVIRKNIFPDLTKEQAYRLLLLVVILIWSVAIAGISAWTYTSINLKGSSRQSGSTRNFESKTFRIQSYSFGTLTSRLEKKLGILSEDVGEADYLISLERTSEIEPAITSGLYRIRGCHLAIKINGKLVAELKDVSFPPFWEPGFPKTALADTLVALMYENVSNNEIRIARHIAENINKKLIK